jgi:hypothetical protein
MRYAWFGFDEQRARVTGFVEAGDVEGALSGLHAAGHHPQSIRPVRGAWGIPGDRLAEWEWEHCLQPEESGELDPQATAAEHLLQLVLRDTPGARIRLELVPAGLLVTDERGEPCGTVEGQNPWPVPQHWARAEMDALRALPGAARGEFSAEVAGRAFRFRFDDDGEGVALTLLSQA